MAIWNGRRSYPVVKWRDEGCGTSWFIAEDCDVNTRPEVHARRRRNFWSSSKSNRIRQKMGTENSVGRQNLLSCCLCDLSVRGSGDAVENFLPILILCLIEMAVIALSEKGFSGNPKVF